MTNTVVQILLSILALSILIAWHEFGHYLFARLCGMRVLQYSIGFGPKLFGFTRKEIEYRVGVIPVGGYVYIFGMTPLEEGAEQDPKAFINRPLWARIVVIAAGPVMNYLLAFVLFVGVFWLWSPSNVPSFLISQVEPNSAAATVGLRSGDTILRIDGDVVSTTSDFLHRISNSHGQPLHLTVKRGAETFAATVKAHPGADGVYRLGIGYVPESFNFVGAVRESLSQLYLQSAAILKQLGQLLYGNADKSQFGGVVEITRQLSNAASQGVKNFLYLSASLSVVLGLFNILPIPSLDGSKIFILLIEGIVRRPLPPKAHLWIHGVGILLILALMLLLTVADIARIFQR